MKIAIFDNLPEGGAKRVVYEQLAALSTEHEVTYYTNDHESFFSFAELSITIKRFSLNLPRFTSIFRPFQEFALFSILVRYRTIAAEIKKDKNDVCIIHSCQVTQAPMLLYFIKIPHLYYMNEALRIVSEAQDFPILTTSLFKKSYEKIRRYLLYIIDQLAVKKAEKIITSSFFTKKNILSFYKKEAVVIYPGVDTIIFKPRKNKKNHFLFIGDKTKMNGYDLIEKVLEKNPELTVNFLTFKKNSFRLSDHDVAKLYSESLATLCLGKNEPFGLAAIESSACGTPVIAIAEGGHIETVVPKKNGWLIPRNGKKLEECMKNIFDTPKEATSLSRTTRDFVLDKFSWSKHTEKLLIEIYKLV